jgi:hypothetical protein
VLIGFLAILVSATGAFGQGFFTNATGVSITNVVRSGYDVTFDVTMTTTGPAFTSAFNPGRLGPTSWVTSTTFGTWTNTFTPAAGLSFSYGVFNGSQNSSTYRFDYLLATTTQVVQYTWLSGLRATTHVLPAVDFDDGSTIPTTSLTLSSSTVLPTGNMQRVFRGSFSHTYGDAGNYTIRVATPCCPNTYYGAQITSPTYGTAATFNAYPVRFTVASYFQAYFASFDFYLYRTYVAYDFPLGTTSTFGTTTLTYSAGTIRQGFSSHDITLNTPGYVGALMATTAADLSVLEVPTASGYALLALALLLAAAGIALLRR